MANVAPAVGADPSVSLQIPLRIVTATALYDGHDAAINLVRRLIQDRGAEVVHLGFNRSVAEIASAALQEDADAVAVSSYQGSHMAFYRFLRETLDANGGEHVLIFGGGGGTITSAETRLLESEGITRVYTADDGVRMGLEGMADDLVARTSRAMRPISPPAELAIEAAGSIGRALRLIEAGWSWQRLLPPAAWRPGCPVIGVTGTGGSGKSTLIDELLRRLLAAASPGTRFALLAVDPTRYRTGGALLGDRMRMNALADERVFMHSLATRRRHLATSAALADALALLKRLGFALVLVETAGTGQADAEVTELADLSAYVMTPEYGGPTQLEKIAMLDEADLVVLNKADRWGAVDALRDVRKQWRRNHLQFEQAEDSLPVFATVADRCADPGVDYLTAAVVERLEAMPEWRGPKIAQAVVAPSEVSLGLTPIPSGRRQYLAEIAAQGRSARSQTASLTGAATRAYAHYESLRALGDGALPAPLEPYSSVELEMGKNPALLPLRRLYNESLAALDADSLKLLHGWPALQERARAERHAYQVRGRTVTGENFTESLSGQRIPKLALPRLQDWGTLLRFLREENLPGHYPYTAGVFPYRHEREEPTRMFAGEGLPERTNRRFHELARGQRSVRLSTAFDPVALYGHDPEPRADIYGCIGMSGVSVATLDDMKRLYSGFDLAAPRTSVSMTINGPAPVFLAWYLHTAVDQQVEKYLRQTGDWRMAERRIATVYAVRPRPRYRGERPPGHGGLGLGTLGISGADLVERETYERIRRDTLQRIRGTVQADILKEDQAQNECLFDIDFSLRLMGDVQAYFVTNTIRNYYTVSVSGYHMAEAGANPVTQLAFTLANGFTLVEYFLARGLDIDDVAPRLSFFFSNGMDPEYAVIGRVARRVWARAMRERYGASASAQTLKYHIQTSGRSLHARAMEFNDIRTTLQALYAIHDNCNSLHTNAYDEALTTPTQESVRRALAVQLIINREFGLARVQNPQQGAFIIEELTDLVEEAVYAEFDRLSERGGVLGAMETGYQRARIQEQGLRYEQAKEDGSLPVVGVNTYIPQDQRAQEASPEKLVRASESEKQAQILAVQHHKRFHAPRAGRALLELERAIKAGDNAFAALLGTAPYCTLGQMIQVLARVGGQYRRRL